MWRRLCLAPKPKCIEGQGDGDQDHGVEGCGQHANLDCHGTHLGEGGRCCCRGEEGDEHVRSFRVGGGGMKKRPGIAPRALWLGGDEVHYF